MKHLHKAIYALVAFILWTTSLGVVQTYGSNSFATPVQKNDPPVGTTAYYELKIRDCIKNGNWTGAKSLLDEAIKKYPQMSAINELMGRYYLHLAENAKRGKNSTDALYDKARYYLIRAISIDEKNVQARYHMLQLETDTRHYSSAIVYCNELLEENPYNEHLWRKKIDLYRQLGNHAEADRLLERLFTIYPGDDQLRKDLVESKTIRARQLRNSGETQGQEEVLRQLIELDPKNADHHRSLTNMLYSTGRIYEAAEAAGRGAAETGRQEFVEKRVGMLCEMSRYREAIEYVKTLMGKNKGGSLASLLKDLEMDAARASQYNDPYTSYAKIYESQHSKEALDYLVNTSMQRWYLDDAAMYIEEALKHDGNSKKLLYGQYLVQKRLGNTRKANSLLEKLYERFPDDTDISEEMTLLMMDNAKELMDRDQYDEALPLLMKIYESNAYPYIKEAAFQRLYTCYCQTKQYAKAEKMLQLTDHPGRVTQMAMLYHSWGKSKNALDYLANAWAETAPADSVTRDRIAYTYEEIALPYIKNLLTIGRVVEAHTLLQQAVTICPENEDILRYGITAAQRKGDTAAVTQYVARGREVCPEDPYFMLKEAQLSHLRGDHRTTLDEIAPLLQEYVGDSLLINLYVETSIDLAKKYLDPAVKQPDEALKVIQAALEVSPENMELYYIQGQAYEQKKLWREAYESYRKYKPGYAEWAEYKHHLEELCHDTLRNALSLEYQQARPGTEDVISGNAYINYMRKCSDRSTMNVGMSYAGRDGTTAQKDTEMTRGGTGVQFAAGWEYAFTSRFTGKAEVAWASRYFPIVLARLSGSYDLRNEWQLAAFASYRLLRSYKGEYGWTRPVTGYDSVTGQPIEGVPEYVRVGWIESKKSMFQLGLGVNKTIDRFYLGGELSGMYFDKKVFFNANAKMKFFPQEGNRSHIFAVAGLGTAPESSLIDNSLPVTFDKLNTFVGFGGSYFVNRWLSFGLSGTWYTMFAQSERLATNYIANVPYIVEDYRNYFYVHGSAIISF